VTYAPGNGAEREDDEPERRTGRRDTPHAVDNPQRRRRGAFQELIDACGEIAGALAPERRDFVTPTRREIQRAVDRDEADRRVVL